jgi:conjugative transfer region protein (TIGR03748 family)
MPSVLASRDTRRRILTALALATLSCGCTQFSTPSTQNTKVASSGSLPVVALGRYTLVEVQPTDAQQDLMRQIVNVELPSKEDATLGDALHVILLGSGYRLCTGHGDTQDLAALPLPAVHNPLGPLTLRDALDVLAGRGWQVEVDESIREVCFGRRP